MTRVLCVGEPLVTLTPPPGGRLLDSHSLHLGIGGAEMNVAIHLARLGDDAAFAGALSTDAFGDRVRVALRGEGVDLSQLRVADGPTGLYFKDPGGLIYHRAGSAGSRLAPIAADVLRTFDLVHVTGVTVALSGDIVKTVEEILATPRTWRVSFDVNYRPALWSPDRAAAPLLGAARASDVVLVGRDEAEAVWGCTDREEIRALLSQDGELVVKDGPDPVEIWAEGRWHRFAPPSAEIVEVVGAGDAFAAAYLSSRLAGRDPVAAAEAGHRLAAHVMSSVADQGDPDEEVYRALAGT